MTQENQNKNLVNQAKSTKSLRNYLYEKLSQIQLYNFVTGQYDNALEILNKNKCYGLTKFMKGKKICDDYPYATQDGKLFGRVIQYKDKSELEPKKQKIVEEQIYTDLVPKYTLKHRYIKVEDLVPKYTLKHRYEYYTDYEPIFKRRKIGKKFYYTTEFKEVTKRRREPYYVTEYIKKTKTVKEPYYVTEYIPTEKVRKVTRYIEQKVDPIKAEYDYKFKYYIQYFLFEMYREEGDKIIHETFINPFYSGYSVVEPTFYTGVNGKPEYVTPEAMWNSGYIQLVTNKAKSDLVGRKPKKLKEGKLDDFFKRERKYKSNYSYDESVIDTVFFTDYDTITNNLKIDKV